MEMEKIVKSMQRFAHITKRHYFRRKGTPKVTSAADAVSMVRSNERVYFHGVAAFPHILAQALADRGDELRDVEVCHIHLERENPCAAPELHKSFFINNFFVGPNMRKAVAEGR
jgi:hypothetical protein